MKKFFPVLIAIAVVPSHALAYSKCAEGIIQQVVVGQDQNVLVNGSYSDADGRNNVTLKINDKFHRLDTVLNLNDRQGAAILAAALGAASTKTTVQLYDHVGGSTCDDWQELKIIKEQ